MSGAGWLGWLASRERKLLAIDAPTATDRPLRRSAIGGDRAPWMLLLDRGALSKTDRHARGLAERPFGLCVVLELIMTIAVPSG